MGFDFILFHFILFYLLILISDLRVCVCASESFRNGLNLDMRRHADGRERGEAVRGFCLRDAANLAAKCSGRFR